MAIRSSSGFSHLRPRAFHIAIQTHKTQHTQPRTWKKRRTNKHGLGLAPSARKEMFVTLLCGFSVHLAIASVYPSEISTQPLGTLTHLLPLTDLASESTGLNLAAAFLCPSPSVDSPETLPFFVFFRSRRKSRAQALCVGFAPKRTKESSDWHSLTPTLTEKNAPIMPL